MHHFAYRGGVLHAEDVNLSMLADEVGTPFYCYSTATLERHYHVFADAFALGDALICYAIKSNSNIAVLRTLGRLGAGMGGGGGGGKGGGGGGGVGGGGGGGRAGGGVGFPGGGKDPRGDGLCAG